MKIKTGSTRCTNTPNDFYKFVKIVNGCWEWLGTKDRDGYGLFTCERVRYRAHRWIYEYYNTLPKKMYMPSRTFINFTVVYFYFIFFFIFLINNSNKHKVTTFNLLYVVIKNSNIFTVDNVK